MVGERIEEEVTTRIDVTCAAPTRQRITSRIPSETLTGLLAVEPARGSVRDEDPVAAPPTPVVRVAPPAETAPIVVGPMSRAQRLIVISISFAATLILGLAIGRLL
jgi:hypothetical protein